MSPRRRFISRAIGLATACAMLLIPVEAGTQAPQAVAQAPARGRAGQDVFRAQIPADGRVMVRRPPPGQVTHLVISVANGGLADGQSEPTEAGKQMIAGFIASLRERDSAFESYMFLVRSHSSPKAGISATATAATTTTAVAAPAAAATQSTATTATTATRTTRVAGAATSTSATAAARRALPPDAVAQNPSGRGAAAAQAVSPIVLQRMQTVQTVRGVVQTGRAAAIQRQLVDVERVAADRIVLYAHGEARPEAPQPDAPIGDYVTIDAYFQVPILSAPGFPPGQAQAMMIEKGDVTLPPFPWPPPKPTSKLALPADWLPAQEPPTLGQVGKLLESALVAERYPDYAYLAVPNGFALVAQLEQIQQDGTPVTPNRWDPKLPSMATMGFDEFLKALFVAPTGYYRVIAFIVTDLPWQQNAPRPTEEQAMQWLSTGLNALPAAVRDMRYTANYQSTALVYEFAKDGTGARFREIGTADPMTHLEKAGLLRTLKR